jgi:hypothetical protein
VIYKDSGIVLSATKNRALKPCIDMEELECIWLNDTRQSKKAMYDYNSVMLW